jgi:hypothetical protein
MTTTIHINTKDYSEIASGGKMNVAFPREKNLTEGDIFEIWEHNHVGAWTGNKVTKKAKQIIQPMNEAGNVDFDCDPWVIFETEQDNA